MSVWANMPHISICLSRGRHRKK